MIVIICKHEVHVNNIYNYYGEISITNITTGRTILHEKLLDTECKVIWEVHVVHIINA